MNNVRFANVLHILTLLRLKEGEQLSSEFIASSVNVNAAVVRKEISNLILYGFVLSKEGKGGGYSLAKSASKIYLSNLYKAVNKNSILGKSHDPNPDCPIGQVINIHLKELFTAADEALLKHIGQITLEDFSRKIF